MPQIWYVKDGPSASVTFGESVEVTYAQIKHKLAQYQPAFLSDGPPTFNQDYPSDYAVHVVVQVRPEDGTSPGFPKPGFYLLRGLSPKKSVELLSAPS